MVGAQDEGRPRQQRSVPPHELEGVPFYPDKPQNDLQAQEVGGGRE